MIEAIQSSGYRAAIVVVGGGSGAVHALLVHPGASRFVIDVRIPYSPEALAEYLGDVSGPACSGKTAMQLGVTALNRASRLQSHDSHTLGIACTAALQTNRIRRGSDRAFVCIKSAEREWVQQIKIEHGSRTEQEDALSAELLEVIAKFVGQGC